MQPRLPWIQTLIGGTRGHLLALLRPAARTVGELAAALGVTDNAVRTHLAALERDGLVRQSGVRRETGGKPAQLYELTRTAEELFPKAYDLVLAELLQGVVERWGEASLGSLLHRVGERLGEAHAAQGMSLGERVRVAAEVMRALGGELDVDETEDGWRLRGHGCPLAAVVTNHPAVCGLTESLLATIIGVAVREACEQGQRPRCAFVVPRQ